MTTLKGIKGDQIRYLDQDPVVQGIASGTWASASSLNTSRGNGTSTGSATTAAIAIGGDTGPPTLVTNTEIYNGSSWTEVNNFNTPRYIMGSAGTTTSSVLFGGRVNTPALANKNETELWNGTSWTSVANMNTGRWGLGSAGISSTSALGFGGIIFPTTTANTESWNGTSWTEVNDLPATDEYMGSSGSATSALSIGGEAAGSPTSVTSWDGTSWSTLPAVLNTGRKYNGASRGIYSNTTALTWGGETPPTASTTNTEYYDGSTWTEVNNLGIARNTNSNGAGTTTGALAITQSSTTPYGIVEEWTTAPTNSIALQEGMLWFNSTSQTLKGYALSVPTGTWASATSMNTARNEASSAVSGTQSSTLAISGEPTGTAVESYNGSSWTAVASTNTRHSSNGSGFGTSNTSAGVAGGSNPTPDRSFCEIYNGTSWTEVNNLNTGRYDSGSSGSSTSAIVAGGVQYPAPTPGFQMNQTELWNGTSWTVGNAMNQTTRTYTFGGTSTSCISATRGEPNLSYVESWDGTSWSEVAELNQARQIAGSFGTSNTSSAVFGGAVPGPGAANNATEIWNGSSWTEVNNLGTTRYNPKGSGGNVAGIAFSGYTGTAPTASTEEFTATAAVATITTS